MRVVPLDSKRKLPPVLGNGSQGGAGMAWVKPLDFKGKDIIKIFCNEFGFKAVRHEGHIVLERRCGDVTRKINISIHSRDIGPSTLRKIVGGSGVTWEEFSAKVKKH